MKKTFIKSTALIMILVLMCTFSSILLVACDEAEEIIESLNKPIYIMVFYTKDAGDSASSVDPIKAAAGEKIQKPADPACPGYEFQGWYTDYGTWQNEYTDFSAMPARNVVLYALWEKQSDEAVKAYEDEWDAKSEEGYLYIHYKRFVNTPEEYAKYNLWVWPKAFTGIEFDWIKENGEVVVDEFGGATCAVDLKAVYDKAGNNADTTTTFLKPEVCGDNYTTGDINDESNYMDQFVGFLIVLKESKTVSLELGGMWESDGGNQFIPKSTDTDKAKFVDCLRSNGSVHIYATQDHVYDYAYSLSDVGEMTNPYENDDGNTVSIANINSSAPSTYPIAATAGGSLEFDEVKGVGYQIMVASFADSDGDGYGDIKGITENLQYLKDLYVDVLWLTPIQLSDSYHGYDIIDYKAIDPKFGTLDDYQELLDEAHELGMTVIMDLVLNHTSVNNVWFQKSSQLDPEYRSFYQWKRTDDPAIQSSESWHEFGGHGYSYYAKFATSMPELNYDYQGTRDAIVDVAEYWLDLGVDGFRIDAVKHIYMADEVTPESTDIIIHSEDVQKNEKGQDIVTDYSSNVTKNTHFFREFNARIKENHPNAYIVGENFDGHAYNVAPYYQGLDSMLNFYMYYNLAQAIDFKAQSPQILSGIGQNAVCSYTDGQNTNELLVDKWDYNGTSNTYDRYRSKDGTSREAIDGLFTSNHDLPRLMNNVLGYDAGGGNWLSVNITDGNAAEALAKSKLIMATLMTLPGVTFIYYGDELGMTSNYGQGEDKTSPHIDRQYRQPFKWTTKEEDSDYITGFSISGDTTYYVRWDEYNAKLKGADEQANDPASMLSYTKKWTELKHNSDVIKYGEYTPISSQAAIFAYKLSYNGTNYYVYHNFNSYGCGDYMNGGSNVVLADDGVSTSYIPAYATVVYTD